MSDNGKIVSCYCSKCKHDTNHDVLFSEDVTSDDDEYWWKDIYSVAKCRGCGELTFLMESSSEDDFEYDDDGHEYLATRSYTYPYKPQIATGLNNTWSVPQSITRVYNETLKALNDNCFMLAAAGFRMIVEATCTENDVQGSTLEVKINNLCKANIITKRDRNRLHSIRFMGNDSVHEMKTPNKSALLVVLEIIDIMIKNLYILDNECRNALEGPISNYDDFMELLDNGLKSHNVGDIDILRNLISQDRRLIKEDLRNFEAILINQINDGTYTKLSLCPPPSTGRKQQYKVIAIN